MDQSLKEELLQKWLQGNLKEDELLQSISLEELNQYKSILQTVDGWVPEGSEEIRGNLQAIFTEKKAAKVISMGRTGWFIGIAASLVLLASVLFFFQESGQVEYYATNENLEVLLPDNTTRVILSPGSRLTYSEFDPKDREVTIAGRVYFDVTETGPFKVKHEEGAVTVLGTKFEVISFRNLFEATCFEGKVEVEHRGKRVNLDRKSRVAYVRGGLRKSQIRNDQPAWIYQGAERFEDDLLLKVIKVMETRYQVQVISEGVSLNRRFTGSIPTNDLQQACRILFTPLGIRYSIEGQKIVLSE